MAAAAREAAAAHGLQVVFPKEERSSFDIHCEIGEEIGVPFPFAKGEHYTIEDLNERWVLKVGYAYISRRAAKKMARQGRHPGCAGETFSNTKGAQKQRDKRKRRRQRAEQESERYLTWHRERYRGT